MVADPATPALAMPATRDNAMLNGNATTIPLFIAAPFLFRLLIRPSFSISAELSIQHAAPSFRTVTGHHTDQMNLVVTRMDLLYWPCNPLWLSSVQDPKMMYPSIAPAIVADIWPESSAIIMVQPSWPCTPCRIILPCTRSTVLMADSLFSSTARIVIVLKSTLKNCGRFTL